MYIVPINDIYILVPIIRIQAKTHLTNMGEAAAVVRLLASIASLIDLSVKVVTRLHEFASETSDVPESFRSLWVRLPLLTLILQKLQSQAEAGRVLDDVVKALRPVVEDTFEQV